MLFYKNNTSIIFILIYIGYITIEKTAAYMLELIL